MKMHYLFSLTIGIAATVSCRTSGDGDSQSSKVKEFNFETAFNKQAIKDAFLYDFAIDQAIGERYIPDNNPALERRELEHLIDLFFDHFKNKYATAQLRRNQSDQGDKHYALRGVHAKGHGCFKGTFEVYDHNTERYKYSIFSKPAVFDNVYIRLSNGDGPPEKDANRTISIGMAIKILDIERDKLLGSFQEEDSIDFLMTNHAGFVVKDLQGFVKVIEGRENGGIDSIRAIPDASLGLAKRLAHKKKDPLATPYWGNLPFKIGNNSETTAVKYLLRPVHCSTRQAPPPEVEISALERISNREHFLTAATFKHSAEFDTCFDFYMQKQKDHSSSPIENARKAWPEDEHLLTLVGQLKIPRQIPNGGLNELGGNAMDGKQVCQHLSFSPWNTTPDFEPLSSLNRARRVIYEMSTFMRRAINEAQNPALF